MKPTWYYESIDKIPYQKLKQKGIHYLLFDLDNTILSPHSKTIEKTQLSLLEQLKKEFTIIIVSNSTKKRVSKIAEILDIPYYPFSFKPRKKVFQKIKKEYQCTNKEMIMIGDQIYTDILGATRVHIHSILVDPISKKENFITKNIRFLEKRNNIERDVL